METDSIANKGGKNQLYTLETVSLQDKEVTVCRSRLHQRLLGIVYMLGMVVLGIVVIGMETNLVDIANLCGVSVQSVSFSLITRSIGSVLGSFSSAFLMLRFAPHHLVFFFVFVMGLLLASIPFITNVKLVDAVFLGFGFGIPVTQAAIQFLTCQVFQEGAGPWLQGNSLAMSIGTVIVPVLHYQLGLLQGYLVMASLTVVFAVLGFLTPKPHLRKDDEKSEQEASEDKPKGANKIDFCIGWMLFWLAGCIVQTTSYLKSYVPQASLLVPVETDLMLTVLMVFCIIGQLVALKLQQEMTLAHLHTQMSLLFGFGLLSMIAVLVFSHSTTVLWISICIYGFCVGPLYGYVFDLWNRCSDVSEVGSAIVIFGVAGSGLFSYLTHSLWVDLGLCSVLMIVNGLGFVVAWIILLYLKNDQPRPSFMEQIEERISMSSSYADLHDFGTKFGSDPNSPQNVALGVLLSLGAGRGNLISIGSEVDLEEKKSFQSSPSPIQGNMQMKRVARSEDPRSPGYYNP